MTVGPGPHRVTALIAGLRAAQRAAHDENSTAAARRAAELAQLTPEATDDNVHSVIGRLKLRLPPPNTTGVILIVEDDGLTARVHADALADIESGVVIARNGAEAEALLRKHNVSIILLDLVLPDSDGRDLLVRMRASAATRSVPIVVITARMDAATQAECFALGADTLLAKPVDADVLTALVAAQLDHAAELRTAGRVDRLTGLANRAALSDTIERLAPLARRTRNPLCVAMIDLDYFKAINDSYGHDVGDTVLREAAQTIVTALRVSDVAARWGGEEFCVLLPDTTSAGAVRALSKALDAVRALVFTAKGESFGVSFSAGVAALAPRGTWEEAVAEADRRLYLAKKSGRNRIFSVEDEADPPRPRILLVEDDEAVSRVVSTLLQREGFAVVCHADGESALHAAGAEHFALAIIDVNVPRLSGLDLIERLRATPASARLPVVLLTGSVEEQDIVRGFQLGANDYVTKPFLPGELAARVNRLVPRR